MKFDAASRVFRADGVELLRDVHRGDFVRRPD
jgi:hypothetical protein